MRQVYRDQLADFENRIAKVRELFANPVITYHEGQLVEDVNATLADAGTLLLGGRLDPTKVGKKEAANRQIAQSMLHAGNKVTGILE